MVVGIIDSGIDTHNTTLMNRVVGGFTLYLGKKKKEFFDTNGHGTLTCNTILAYAPNTQFVVVRTLDENLKGSTKDILESIEILVTMGVSLINLSLSTSNIETEPAYQKLFTALKKKNVYLLAARHNDSTIPISLPAMLPECIGVDGSIMLKEGEFWYNPNYEYQMITSRTPVLTTGLGGKKEFYGGTSKATAVATGLWVSLLEQTKGDINRLPQVLAQQSTQQNWNIPLDLNFSKQEITQKEEELCKLIHPS